jgi:predicted CopG family antitoxin
MGSRTISVKDEAYSRLKALKDDDKSFSDVILELTENKNQKFGNIVGKGIDTSFEELKEERKRSEEDDDREALLRGH